MDKADEILAAIERLAARMATKEDMARLEARLIKLEQRLDAPRHTGHPDEWDPRIPPTIST